MQYSEEGLLSFAILSKAKIIITKPDSLQPGYYTSLSNISLVIIKHARNVTDASDWLKVMPDTHVTAA